MIQKNRNKNYKLDGVDWSDVAVVLGQLVVHGLVIAGAQPIHAKVHHVRNARVPPVIAFIA